MDALLILVGVLLVAAGLIWLIILAFGTGLLWGISSLLPPLTLVYVVRHWAVARKAVGLAGLGFIPLVVGFTLLASHDPERIEAIASLEWLQPDLQAQGHELAMSLHGQLHGKAFKPHVGRYRDGVLVLREGDELFARQEVTIRLGAVPSEAVEVDVLPGDAGPLPEVEISWMGIEQELPEARRVQSGYTLHLDLQPEPPNKLVGAFHLVLPAHYQTSLSGRVELLTNDLRYRDGQVDLTHDAMDTIEYLVKDHLQRRFKTRSVNVKTLSPVHFPTLQADLSVQAVVDGESKPFELDITKGKQGWAIVNDVYPALPDPMPIKEDVKAVQPIASLSNQPLTGIDRRHRFSLARLLRDPARYEQLQVRAHTERGAVAEGRFVGLDRDGYLAIRQRVKGPGEVAFNLNPDDIVLLELLDP